MDRGGGRDAQIDVVTPNSEAQPAILRQPPLGDIETGHDLDARDERRFQVRRQRLLVSKGSIDAKPDLKNILGRLDMNIRGLRFGGAADQGVHRTHHGSVAGKVSQPLDITLVSFAGPAVEGLDRI